MPKIQKRRNRTRYHQRRRKRITPAPFQFREPVLEVHTVNAGNERGRQESNAGHRKNFDDFILIDVDETNRRVPWIIETWIPANIEYDSYPGPWVR